MFHGVLALFGRSLRTDARSFYVQLMRGLPILVVYISILFTLSSRSRFGAPGLQMFRALVWLNAIFAGLLSIGYFSTSISEEKEEDTLGLMQMAGISPLGILLGKVGGRVFQTLLLIAVQYPFTLLAVTMGGVTPDQVWSAYVGVSACTFLFSGMGLLCSTIASRNRTASALMTLGIVAYISIPLMASEVVRYFQSRGTLTTFWAGILDGVYSSSLYVRIGTILSSGFGESPFSIQVVSNMAGGIVCYLLSWGLFGVCTQSPATERTTRGLLAHPRGMLRWFAPGRPGHHPFAWTGFYFVGGGMGGLLLRIAAYLLLAAFGLLFAMIRGWGWNSSFAALLQNVGMTLLALDVAILASRTVQEEVHGQTLQSLVMLPRPVSQVIYAKLGGALMVSLPGIAFLGLTLLLPHGLQNLHECFNEHAGWFFFAHFVLAPHVAMVLSMYLRWGIVPLSIGIAIGSAVAWVAFFSSVRIGPADHDVWYGTAFACAISVACHFWMTRTLPANAAQR